MKKALYKAMTAHYVAEMESARATLKVYFNGAAGIGEHPQVVDEMVKQVDKFTNAEDCLHALKANFSEDGGQELEVEE